MINTITHRRFITGGLANIVTVLLCLSFSLCSFAQTSSREYNIKAAFLYNFTQFVEWPAKAFAGSEAPFVIGILGEDPFQSVIDETVAKEKVNGHPIVVRRYKEVQEVKNCHILYISMKEALKVTEILSAIPEYVLTVSDIPNFARTGGMVHFINQSNKIRLQINSAAVKAADLNISSKLLRVAEIVDKAR